MKRIIIAAALALAVTLPAVSAQAQSPRTFVSAAGSDSNPCTFAAPCRHFQAAVNATTVGGEVDALDPAGYGPITISHAITIEGEGWSYVAPPNGGNAISITAGSGDDISVRGVSLNGVGTTNTNGIIFFSGASLNIQNSVIRNFSNAGIDYGPNVSSHLFMSNTLVSDNGNYGIYITSSGTVDAVLDNVTMENNNQVVGNSGNTFAALWLQSATTVMIRNCTIASNNLGMGANNGSIIRITRSTITGNTTGWSGQVLSYGDNNIDGNTNANTAPPCVNGTSPCSAYK